MKIKYLIVLSAILFLAACEENVTETPEVSTEINTVLNEDTLDEKEQTIVDINVEDDIQLVNKRKTIEGFWDLFKTAVLERELNDLEALYSPNEHLYTFGEDDYQKYIKESKSSNIVESVERFNGKKVYEYVIVFNYEDSEVAGNEENEIPTTTIYMVKNDKNEFEIFSVIEAG